MKRFVEFCGSVLIAGCLFTTGLTPEMGRAAEEKASNEAGGGMGSFDLEKRLPGLKDLKADGEMIVETDEKGDLSELRMSDNVVLVSRDLDLECDLLVFAADKQCLVAKATVAGHRVKVRKQDVKARCLELRYYQEDGKMVLTGSPEVEQKGGMLMKGEEISIIQGANGKTKVMTRGPRITSPTSGDKGNPLDGLSGLSSAAGKDEKKPAASGAKSADAKAAKADSKSEKAEAPKATEDESKGSLAEIPKEAAPQAADAKAAGKADKAGDSDAKAAPRKKASVSN
jgi:lipopolysaccharide export system protein LptA